MLAAPSLTSHLHRALLFAPPPLTTPPLTTPPLTTPPPASRRAPAAECPWPGLDDARIADVGAWLCCWVALCPAGTPHYLSPEVCNGQRYDQKSDIWALGCVVVVVLLIVLPVFFLRLAWSCSGCVSAGGQRRWRAACRFPCRCPPARGVSVSRPWCPHALRDQVCAVRNGGVAEAL
jgi:hypothetical protein